MKYLALIIDKIADVAQPELSGKTPLEASAHPSLDFLTLNGTAGMTRNLSIDFPLSDDVAKLSVFGYEPSLYYSGSGPFEALSNEIALNDDEVAYRCDFVNIKNKVMEDPSAGGILSEEAKILTKMLDTKLGSDKHKFHHLKDYKGLFISRKTLYELKVINPCDVVGKNINDNMPSGKGKKTIIQLMTDANLLLEGHEVNRNRRLEGKRPANMIWLHSGGSLPKMPKLKEKLNLEGSILSFDDFTRGLGIHSGLEPVKIGMPEDGTFPYAKIVEIAFKNLKKKDLVVIHLSNIESASNAKDALLKVKIIEELDREFISKILESVKDIPEYKILLSTDYATDVKTSKPAFDQVPFVIYSPGTASNSIERYTEAQISKSEVYLNNGFELMGKFVQGI